MAKWRVYNRHPEGLTHKEKFRGETIEIPANGYVVMDYEDAVQFRSQYFPMMKNAQGAPDPRGFKVIALEPHGDIVPAATQPKEFICNYDGMKFPTQKALDAHIEANFADQVFKDEAIEAEIEKEEKAKRGPGRPAKEKTA
jgi:hypothetical protein